MVYPDIEGQICIVLKGNFIKGSFGSFQGLDNDDDYLIQRIAWKEEDTLVVSYYEDYEFDRGSIVVAKRVRI